MPAPEVGFCILEWDNSIREDELEQIKHIAAVMGEARVFATRCPDCPCPVVVCFHPQFRISHPDPLCEGYNRLIGDPTADSWYMVDENGAQRVKPDHN